MLTPSSSFKNRAKTRWEFVVGGKGSIYLGDVESTLLGWSIFPFVLVEPFLSIHLHPIQGGFPLYFLFLKDIRTCIVIRSSHSPLCTSSV